MKPHKRLKTKLKIILVIAIIMLCFPSFTSASEEATPPPEQETAEQEVDIDEIKGEIWDQLLQHDLAQWQAELDGLESDLLQNENISGFIYDYAVGEAAIAPDNLFESAISSIQGEIGKNIGIVVGLLCTALISGFADVIIGDRESLKTVTGFICYGLSLGIVVYSIANAVGIAQNAITDMANFIDIVIPPTATMLVAVGGTAANGAMSPLLSFLSGTVAKVIQTAVLPVVLAGGVLSLINNLSGNAKLGQLHSLSKSSSKWILGLVFTLYIGITTISGISVASVSGLSVRTAKFAIDKFVPVIGGMVSGTVDTVLGCAMLVKNAAGIAAILMAVAKISVPLFSIAGMMFAFRISAALCEPISPNGLPKMLSSVADMCGYLFAAVLGIGLMFIITMGIIISTGNIYISG